MEEKAPTAVPIFPTMLYRARAPINIVNDDIFDKMYKDFEDTVPGEQPLTKKKRTLNAEGGLNYLLGF